MARLLTIQELRASTGITNIPTWSVGELDNFTFLLENTVFSNNNTVWAWWLETPRSDTSDYIWHISGYDRFVAGSIVSNVSGLGIRPVIEVSKTNIEY